MIGAAVTKSKYRPADMLYLLIINKITSFKHCGAVVCVSANEGGFSCYISALLNC